MVPKTSNILDLTRDLKMATDLGASVEQVNEILGQAVDTLGGLIPFDLATIMELEGERLEVRVARGPLAGEAVDRHHLDLDHYPSIQELLRKNRARTFTEPDHRDGDGDAFDGVLDLPPGHSCMVVPLRTDAQLLGIMTFDRQVCGEYPASVVDLADVFGKLLAMAMSYGEQSSLLTRLARQLREQNRVLGEQVDGRNDACSLLEASRSASMVKVVQLGQRVAVADTPVLITGETGTGKEVLAGALHGWSPRAAQPMVSINCAALPENLIESELFGHVKGAFSGATRPRMGRFQAANGGTLFLDEVGDLPVDLQAKLLRVLQEGCFEPVGSDRTIRVDVRVVAATNVDLVAAVADRRFRQDLYYRLAVFPIHLPPLRERPEDIETIATGFLDSLMRRTGRGPWHLSASSILWLERQPWIGNVRELVNALERATILSLSSALEFDSDPLPIAVPPDAAPPAPGEEADFEPLAEMERRHIERALLRTAGKIYGAGGAAELLGLNPNTLRSRMQKHGLGGARNHRPGE
jgi:transcriptional regulator with GAF, ATPase, and Fis domain